MSEYINNHHRLTALQAYAFGVLNGERGVDLYREYQQVIDFVTPKDVITIVDNLVKTGKAISDVKQTVNKILNTFYSSLRKQGPAMPPLNHVVSFLMSENQKMKELLKVLKDTNKRIFKASNPSVELQNSAEDLKIQFEHLLNYEKHYMIMENVLFPYFERAFEDHKCVNVMWSMHDDARTSLNNLIGIVEDDAPNINDFNLEMGRYYFSVLPVIFREDYILYPEALRVIPEEDWKEMLDQSLEIGFTFMDENELKLLKENLLIKDEAKSDKSDGNLIDLDTGELKIDQIKDLFNHLPVDITYVDENDEVRYFSNPKDRFFTRSKAIIGRKVQNCHPPESIDIVNRIVESFKKGESDEESFWIQMKERFILIQYFAIRDKNNKYKGVVEVSQDITNIRKLDGEKRLLDE
jgi:hypothetical protein